MGQRKKVDSQGLIHKMLGVLIIDGPGPQTKTLGLPILVRRPRGGTVLVKISLIGVLYHASCVMHMDFIIGT